MKANKIFKEAEKPQENKIQVSFAAINQYVEDNIIKNNQREIRGKELVEYGDKNLYPQYLFSLYQNVAVLRSVITGIADYACGEEVTTTRGQFAVKVNDDDTLEDLVRKMVLSLELYGGIALNVLRNRLGEVAQIWCLDFKNVRSNKKNTKFWYSEEWGEKQLGRIMTTSYPVFNPNGTEPSSIFYFKLDDFDTYPTPSWAGAVISAECLKHISEFHINSLFNGLSSDFIINFLQGNPSDEEKAQIEEAYNDKLCGFSNGSRSILSFAPDFQHRTMVEAIPQNNFIDRYNALYTTSIKDIFTAFRAHPSIFGLPIENTGFNDQDLREGFKLFNRTVILPIQKIIKRIFETILGEKDVIKIEPFNIDWSDEAEKDFVK